jgi:hypothetical protein
MDRHVRLYQAQVLMESAQRILDVAIGLTADADMTVNRSSVLAHMAISKARQEVEREHTAAQRAAALAEEQAHREHYYPQGEDV